MANPKILICDDEEGIRESLKLILGDHYSLVTVDSGDMALEVLSHSQGNQGHAFRHQDAQNQRA